MIEMRVVAPERVGPAVICDACGRRIDDMGLGMVKHGLIHAEPVGATTEYLTVHKGECDKATEGRGLDGWTELDVFLMRSIANSTPPDDRDPASMERRVLQMLDRAGRWP